MKKIEDVPVEQLRAVFTELFDGIWGEDKDVRDPIVLRHALEPKVETVKDRANMALHNIHRERIHRIADRQMKNLDMDVLLLGVGKNELIYIQAAIDMSIRDYLRPLADAIGFWEPFEDEDDAAAREAGLTAHVDLSVAAGGEPPKTE